MVRQTTVTIALVFLLLLGANTVSAAVKDAFTKGVTVSELREKYDQKKITILLVVGHEPMYGGAVYRGVYEREIVVDIAQELERLLAGNTHYDVLVSRDGEQWHPYLERFFTKEEKDTKKFIKAQKKKLQKLVKYETIDAEEVGVHKIQHTVAREDVALRLYGINRWANENRVDLLVHLHVNDAPDHGSTVPSKYTGFAVYVPDAVYGNSETSAELGQVLVKRLAALGDTSTLPGEDTGVVYSRDLIALGANGTLYVPSVLIEYGYISEPRFTLSEYRQTVTKDAAYQTYLALQDFFNDPIENPRAVAKLPATWPKPVVSIPTPVADASCIPFTETIFPAKNEKDIDTTGVVKRLQIILAKDKTIYPEGLVTGYFGPATKKAVQTLQEKQDIVSSGTPETTGYGAVGPKTAKALYALCSGA